MNYYIMLKESVVFFMQLLDKINNSIDIKSLNLSELNQLSVEIREFLINNISKTGGHLASNLGVVELTIALLYNFNFTKDKIVFDVGHQSYVYKILTDRKQQFNTLRQYKGLSGFPKREESKFDFFDTGHSSNSISASLGMARARDLKGEDYNIISVIGDGALTGGMVYEALNDLGFNHSKMLIILNDNEMSISVNVGGLQKCLNKVRLTPSYNKLKEKVHYKLDRKNSNKLVNIVRKIKNSFKSLFFTPIFFEDLGIRYIGPIDGNNIKDLNKILKKIKNLNEPIVLHVVTTKGLGYLPALQNPNQFHAVSKFDIKTGKISKPSGLTYSEAFGSSLVSLAKNNKKIVAITASMVTGTGLGEFSEIYPNRLFDVGITEEHAVTLAGGMATNGLKPIFVCYSTFLQRGFDQLLMDVCLQNLPVVFAIDRAGLVGNDGKTHQGIFDLSYLNMMPNMEILTPKCANEMSVFLEYAFSKNNPISIRYPKGRNTYKLVPIKKIKSGKWEMISDGDKVIILATGKMVEIACLSKEKLPKKYNPIIINALFIKPLDKEYLKKIVKQNYNVLTLEDNNIIGGFGQQVLYELNNLGFRQKIKILGYQDKFIDHGTIDELLVQEHMDINSIILEIKNLYK